MVAADGSLRGPPLDRSVRGSHAMFKQIGYGWHWETAIVADLYLVFLLWFSAWAELRRPDAFANGGEPGFVEKDDPSTSWKSFGFPFGLDDVEHGTLEVTLACVARKVLLVSAIHSVFAKPLHFNGTATL